MFALYLIVLLLILLSVNRWKPTKFAKLHRQLGNDWWCLPVVGNGMKFIGNNEDLMKSLTQLQIHANKRNHKAMSIWLGNELFVATTPSIARSIARWVTFNLRTSPAVSVHVSAPYVIAVLANVDHACFALGQALDKAYIQGVVKHLLGDAIIFASEDVWHRRRKALASSFAPHYVNKFVAVFEAQIKVAANLLELKVGKGNFSCFEYINPYAVDSVCETLFGASLDVQRQPSHPFFNAYMEWAHIVAYRICRPWLYIDGIYKLLPMSARQMLLGNIMQRFIDNLINKNKEQMHQTDQSFETSLQLIFENSNDTHKPYTDKQLREESVGLILTASDTTAIQISTTLILLSQHDDVQEKVYREIQDVLGDSDKPLKYNDLLKLKYTISVIKESLRLYPAAPFVVRYCKNDLKLSPDLTLPGGCNIFVSIWGIQRDPQYWGKDANEFNPDRFMSTPTFPPKAFLAFGYSSRNCIGQHYAMLSLTTALVVLLRRYRFTPATNFKYDARNPLRLSFELLIKHVDKFSVQIERRS